MYLLIKRNWDKTKHIILFSLTATLLLLLTVVYKNDEKVTKKCSKRFWNSKILRRQKFRKGSYRVPDEVPDRVPAGFQGRYRQSPKSFGNGFQQGSDRGSRRGHLNGAASFERSFQRGS